MRQAVDEFGEPEKRIAIGHKDVIFTPVALVDTLAHGNEPSYSHA